VTTVCTLPVGSVFSTSRQSPIMILTVMATSFLLRLPRSAPSRGNRLVALLR
jgi:hypothetical protein